MTECDCIVVEISSLKRRESARVLKNGFIEASVMAELDRSKKDRAISSESYGPGSKPSISTHPVQEQNA